MAEMDAYLHNGDSSFRFRRDGQAIRFTSQVWQGAQWEHSITLNGAFSGATDVLLVVTGGDVNDLDEAEASWLSELSGLPVATLYNVPNQPLFDDLWEDDLIAFTFIRYLATGDSEWPLLFPMVKSVIRAMDAVEGATGHALRFVVTGLSKRGWTSWLAGASGDSRIAGIAPMVIDHLNIRRQMEHQLATWGEYSEQIKSYTDLELPKELDSEEGQYLNGLVDPYSYRHRINVPILIVTGSNDRYWQVDATEQYWNELPDPKWDRVIPNVEHILGDKIEKNQVLAAFARRISQGPLPKSHEWHWEFSPDHVRISISPEGGFAGSRLWEATSQDYEFRDKPWKVVAEGHSHLAATLSKVHRTALFAEMAYRSNGLAYSVTTPVSVVAPPRR